VQSHGGPGAAGGSSLSGNLMIMGAVVCESTYVILSRRLSQTLPAIEICAYTHGLGLLLMLPLGAGALLHFDYTRVAGPTWLLLIWYGLSASIFSFWLWMKGIRHVPGALAGTRRSFELCGGGSGTGQPATAAHPARHRGKLKQ